MSDRPKPKVGDRLYAVRLDSRRPPEGRWVEVTKLGNKYFTTHNLGPGWEQETKFEIASWRLHDQNWPQQCYTSEIEHDAEQETKKARIALIARFADHGRVINKLDLDQIERINAILEEVQ